MSVNPVRIVRCDRHNVAVERLVDVDVSEEGVGKDALAVLKSAVVWDDVVTKGNGPVSCATMRGVVTIEKFPAGSYRVIVVLEPSPSPLDGEKC